jgi:hypothetical protein
MDFGAGRRIPGRDDPAYALAGTPHYLAPELLVGQKPSVASDIFSVGVLLFHLVSGEYPFRRGESSGAGDQAARERVLLRDLRPSLPSPFVDLIERALSSNPAERYRTAGEFGAALAAVAGTRHAVSSPRRMSWKIPAAVLGGIAIVAAATQLVRGPDVERVPAAGAGLVDVVAPLPVAPASYQVAASLHAARAGQEVRLASGSRVQPGDELFMTLEASRPVFVYVVNQDEAGSAFLLFPLPGYEPANPIPAAGTVRLPGSRDGEQHSWQVTSAGGREHFLVYVSPERLGAFEQVLTALPRAEVGRSVEHVPLTPALVGTLRGVGGVVPGAAPRPGMPTLAELQPMPDGREMTSGVWARRITLENPVR